MSSRQVRTVRRNPRIEEPTEGRHEVVVVRVMDGRLRLIEDAVARKQYSTAPLLILAHDHVFSERKGLPNGARHGGVDVREECGFHRQFAGVIRTLFPAFGSIEASRTAREGSRPAFGSCRPYTPATSGRPRSGAVSVASQLPEAAQASWLVNTSVSPFASRAPRFRVRPWWNSAADRVHVCSPIRCDLSASVG